MTPTARPLERFAYTCYMGLLIASIPGVWFGILFGLQSGNFRGLILGLVGLGLSRCLHVIGHAHWHFRECEASLTFASYPGAGQGPQAVAEVAQLLEKFEAEEDIWERADLRRQITARLSARPQLRETFRETLSSHPDL